jgi:hypothetical protein
MRLLLSLISLSLLLSACSLPNAGSSPVVPGATPRAETALPEPCRGDGAVQTWQLLAVQPAESELVTAYDNREVVEFSGAVFAGDDDPARLPHRRYLIRAAAEGITVTLDYQGDPPPLAMGPRYRFVAWANFLQPSEPAGGAVTPFAFDDLPDASGYELQVHDSRGLLFLGLTDTDLSDDPLGVRMSDAEGDCPPVVITNNPCVETRQVRPLRVQWGDDEITLYPGEDGSLQHDGALYEVSLFRNRRTQLADPVCPDYREHQRSLRIERVDPPPDLPSPSEPLTATAPLTATSPFTPGIGQ